MGKKIRKATISKTPYMCIIGDKEISNNTVNIRKRNGENIGEMTIEEMVSFLKEINFNRR